MFSLILFLLGKDSMKTGDTRYKSDLQKVLLETSQHREKKSPMNLVIEVVDICINPTPTST